jgi:mono/diheme cytochrome c family protein
MVSSIVVLAVAGCGDASNTTTGSADATPAGARAGPPVRVDLAKQDEPTKAVIVHTGCLACHQIGDSGNRELAPNLTHIGSRIPKSAILRALEEGPAIMPSFRSLGEKKLNEVADFLSQLE